MAAALPTTRPAIYLGDLGLALMVQFEHAGRDGDLDRAVELLQ